MALGVSSRVLQLVGTLVLTRFIAPDDYGAVLTASIAVMTASVFTSFAFGQSLIAKKASAEIAMQAMIIHVGLGVVAMAVVYLGREPLGRMLETPDMGQYVLGYAIATLLDRARYVPERLIMRALRFRALATINGLGEIVFTGVALALARSYGAHAVMIAALVRSSLTSALFFLAAPRAEWLVRTGLRGADVRELLAYGWPIMIAAISDRAATRWDNLIMSKLFDPGVMGRYNLAYSLAEMPISHVAEHIGEVLMPSFARMEDEQRRSAVIRAASLMALIVAPLGVGLGAVAPTVVATFFDERWAAMGPMLTILAMMALFRPTLWSAIAYLQAIQQTRLVMLSSFFRAAIVLSLVYVFGLLGEPEWACIGACIGYFIHSVVTVVVAGRVAGFSVRAYLLGASRPILPCIPMFAAVWGLERVLSSTGVPLTVSLILQVIAGAAVYIASAFVLARPSVDELLRLGREALRRRR